ncbi:MAG: ABC transporter ATP-binding protein/permease [Hyphomicrobium sp.]|jgi:ATP-binding cassette subfamily B multidrug efflux pump|nr:ABC transporter ATP-binding protein/permease [Hyphomicrobium sp.]
MFSWFERLIDPYARVPLEPPPAGLAAFFWHYVKPVWPVVLAIALLTAAIAALEIVMLDYVGRFVDLMSTADRATFFAQHGGEVVRMALLALVVLPLLAVTWEFIFHQSFAGNFPMMIRWQGHRYLLRQSLSFFQDDFAGRIANTLMQTALGVRDSVERVINTIVYAIVYVVSALVVLSAADWRLAIPLAVWIASYVAAGSYFMPRLARLSEAQAEARSAMTGRVIDSYTNITSVKLFAHTAAEDAYAKESMQAFMETVYAQMRLVTKMNVCLRLLNYGLMAVTLIVSIFLWRADLVTVGAIAVATSLAMRLDALSDWVLWQVAGLFESMGVVRDGATTLSKPLGIVDKSGAPALEVKKGAIDFDNVTFHYGKGRGVIQGLNLRIAPGEKVGLVGRSGAGKSTLVNLLLRFFEPESGRVMIDGQDIRDVTQESLRRAIGVVTQDTALLHRSVGDNLRYGRPDASSKDVERAMQLASAAQFIEGLGDGLGRKGLDAMVGERGVKLSGGQRQRIAIARVLLKNAPILVLDEATSALDSEVEAAIQESLNDLMAGKTVIAIAHRLSTIAAMDRLVVMDGGQIVEEGSHAELVARGGLYASLWKRQSGGFLAGEAVD